MQYCANFSQSQFTGVKVPLLYRVDVGDICNYGSISDCINSSVEDGG
jgi:hypothetical protein